MTVCEWQAACIEQAGKVMAHWVETTEPGRVDWKPAADAASRSRSVLDVANECIQTNRAFASMLSGRETESEGVTPASTPEGAGAQLRESSDALAAVVRKLDESALDRIYPTPMGQMPGRAILGIALGHLFYHGGQVNMVQLLYGDTEFRYPR